MKIDEMKEVELQKLELDLPCVLTSEELLAKADEVAKLDAKLASLRLQKKEMTEQISGNIKGAEGAARVLLGHIRQRSETRAVKCLEVADYDRGQVNVVRTDTGDIVSSRGLRPEERQSRLHGIDGGKASNRGDDRADVEQ